MAEQHRSNATSNVNHQHMAAASYGTTNGYPAAPSTIGGATSGFYGYAAPSASSSYGYVPAASVATPSPQFYPQQQGYGGLGHAYGYGHHHMHAATAAPTSSPTAAAYPSSPATYVPPMPATHALSSMSPHHYGHASSPSGVSGGMVMTEVKNDSQQFWEIEREFDGWLNNRTHITPFLDMRRGTAQYCIIEIECYNCERIKKGERPLTFRLISAATITNPRLEAQFNSGRQRLMTIGRNGIQIRVERAFHGNHLTAECHK